MSKNTVLIVSLIVGFCLAACAFILGVETIGPRLATGAQVTATGYGALLSSVGGSVLSFVVAYFSPHLGVKVPANATNEITELTLSFAALLQDKSSKPAQRRFIFALADASSFIPGVTASHENGVIVIRYSGYADPVQPSA